MLIRKTLIHAVNTKAIKVTIVLENLAPHYHTPNEDDGHYERTGMPEGLTNQPK